LAGWRALLTAAAAPAAAAAAEMQDIDWDMLSKQIVKKVIGPEGTVKMPARRQPVFSFMPLAAAAALLVVIGLGIFFWTRPGLDVGRLPQGQGISPAAISRLQSGMARKEVVSYLQQSQLMLTDLLNDCSSEEVAAREIGLYSRKAKELLLKKKYFQQNLPAVEWIKVRNVSERIDWLNYEILQLEDRQICRQIYRLQRIMENERLLLKIRLLERDISTQPYQEV
jgi:hypothetical protein